MNKYSTILITGLFLSLSTTIGPAHAELSAGHESIASPLAQIQALRALGQLDKAIYLGQSYLRAEPTHLDIDVVLVVGLMLLQKQDYPAAETYLNRVLLFSPHYLEAKLALIHIQLAEKRFTEANHLIEQIKQEAPNDPRVIKIQKDFAQINTLQTIEKNTPKLSSTLLPIVVLPHQGPAIPSPLKQIQALRAKNQLDQAITIGQNYLRAQPKNLDNDILLLMGLMMVQKQNYPAAKNYFNELLILSPHYLEAKIGLISIYMAQKEYAQAAPLIKQLALEAPQDPRVKKLKFDVESMQKPREIKVITYNDYFQQHDYKRARKLAMQVLARHPDDIPARLMLAQIDIAEKQFLQARAEFTRLLEQHPLNKKVRLAFIDAEIAQGHDIIALRLVRQALKLYPDDPDFLTQRATLYLMQHMYTRAADLDKQLLKKQPNNPYIQDQYKQIQTLNPHFTYGLNEVGINTEGDYVSGLNGRWQYTSLYYSYDTPGGIASIGMNDATRFGVTANQGVINLFPVLNKNLYLRITGAYANQPLLFPTYLAGAEAYSAALPVELSLGTNYSWIIPNIAFAQYTGSINKEWRDYWFSFRPNYYVPLHGPTSTLYTATILKYFGPKDTYFRITAGSGYSPNLADLTTVDFIVVKNNFVTALAQFPVINHSLLMSIGGNYQHWVFPKNGTIWNISGLIIGFNYRFEAPSSQPKNQDNHSLLN